jgi:hypothetical protein
MLEYRNVLLIVNPVARTFSKATLAVIEKALSADFRLEVVETKERGHAAELAAQAVLEGTDLVVVFSGDGTVNEVVNALAGSDTAIAALPGGATNIFVRALGLPLDPVEATGTLIAKALDDQAFKLSLGVADGRYFAVNCGAGVDAAAMRRIDARFPRTAVRSRRSCRRVGAAVATRGARPTSRSDDGEPLPSLSVMVGRTDPHVLQGSRHPHDARGLARRRPDARRKLNRRNVPRIAWQVFGSARHVHGRDIDYVHDASHILVTSATPLPITMAFGAALLRNEPDSSG